MLSKIRCNFIRLSVSAIIISMMTSTVSAADIEIADYTTGIKIHTVTLNRTIEQGSSAEFHICTL